MRTSPRSKRGAFAPAVVRRKATLSHRRGSRDTSGGTREDGHLQETEGGLRYRREPRIELRQDAIQSPAMVDVDRHTCYGLWVMKWNATHRKSITCIYTPQDILQSSRLFKIHWIIL